jgi:hypothetical protein
MKWIEETDKGYGEHEKLARIREQIEGEGYLEKKAAKQEADRED